MKTAELTGAALDLWVARAEGMPIYACGTDSWPGNGAVHRETFERPVLTVGLSGCLAVERDGKAAPYSPSTNWAQGGPIIERDQIMLQPPSEVHYNGGPNHGWKRYDHWRATVSSRTRTLPPQNDTQAALGIRPVGRGAGETPLVAAMRAYVASKFGDEVPVSSTDQSGAMADTQGEK